MKKRIVTILSVLLPLLLIALVLRYEVQRKKEQAKLDLGNKLFNVCAEGAQKSKDYAASKDLIGKVCGCFAGAIIRHNSISAASIISDPNMVKAILQDCAKRSGH